MSEFTVSLIGCTENPQTLSVIGALGCFEEKSSAQLLEELSRLPEDQRLKKEKGVLKNSFGRGHGSVGDQNCFVFSIENLPRVATLQLCLPEYLGHLQQSLRRAKASRGFYLPEAIKNSKLAAEAEKTLLQSFDLYEKMAQTNIPSEDARFLLPLYTKTNIQTAGNARELCHLWQMTNRDGVPSVVKAVVGEMFSLAKEKAPYLFEDFSFNYETLAWYPSAQLFALTNASLKRLIRLLQDKPFIFLGWIGKNSVFPTSLVSEMVTEAVTKKNEAELANLKHIHFEFLSSMSLACFHQAIRQRTWDQSVESVYDAVDMALSSEDRRMVIPPSIKKSDFASVYQHLHAKMLNLYAELIANGIPRSEAIGVIPHSLRIYDLIHINGWNALHSIGKRACIQAQWEIRKIAWKIAKAIKGRLPSLGKWTEPQCITYGGKCPEIKDCGYYKKIGR